MDLKTKILTYGLALGLAFPTSEILASNSKNNQNPKPH